MLHHQLKHHNEDKMAQLTNPLQAFENTSTSIAASQMRNALNKLSDTVEDPAEKKVNYSPTSSIYNFSR